MPTRRTITTTSTRLDNLAILLPQKRFNKCQRTDRLIGLRWIIFLSFASTFASAFNAEKNNTPSSSSLIDDELFNERESRSFYVKHRNNNDNNQLPMQKHLPPLHNRLSFQEPPKRILNNHFIGTPTSFQHHHNHNHPHPNQNRIHAYVIKKKTPPPPGINNRRPPLQQDLLPAAQTLYDLRGFHIPLGGQEETQRFLRQQSELEQNSRTKPLVFPSFFQPQTSSHHYSDTHPQAINIFGHNQHHQQTNRYTLPGPGRENPTFRPSQPDLSLTTSTENVFKPLLSPIQNQDRTLESSSSNANKVDNNNVRINNPNTGKIRPEPIDDPFVYVYDDLEYDEIEQEITSELDKSKSSHAKTQENDSPSYIRSNQPTAVIESPPTAEPQTGHVLRLNQNNFDLDSGSLNGNDNSNNFFLRQETPPFHASNPFGHYERPQTFVDKPQQRPRVEIVPSSERKPPPDQSNSINHNLPRQRPTPIVYEDVQPSYELQKQLIHSGPHANNEFQSNLRFLPPQQFPSSQGQSNFITNEIPHYNRNQNLNKERPIAIEHDFSNQFVQDPIPFQRVNPTPPNHEFRQPEQPLRPVNTVFPPTLIENVTPSPGYIINEQGVPELVEVFRELSTKAPTPTTPTSTTTTTIKTTQLTTPRPLRRNPFPTRHRLVPTARIVSSTTAEPTTIQASTRGIGIRQRQRSTSTAAPLEVSENYIISDVENRPLRKPGVRKFFQSEEPTSLEPEHTHSKERHSAIGRQRLFVTPTPGPQSPSGKPSRQFTEEVQVPEVYNEENLILVENPVLQKDQYVFQRTPSNDLPSFPNEFGVVHQQSFVDQTPRFRRPTTTRPTKVNVKSPGKPLYLNASDKEGGLYADYIIPIGHIYGSPIPFLPINQIMEKMPGLFQGHSISPQLPRSPTVIITSKPVTRQKAALTTPRTRFNNNINSVTVRRPSTGLAFSTTTSTTSLPPVPIRPGAAVRVKSSFESETNTGVDNLITQSPPHGKRIKPLRRRIKPSSTPENVTVRTYSQVTSITVKPVPIPALEVSLPATSKPNPLKRRPRPRFRITTTTISSPVVSTETERETAESEEEDEAPNPRPRPRKLIKKLRPTRRSFRKKIKLRNNKPGLDSESSEESVTQASVQVFRKPTETPGRFSSRFRDEDAPLTPTPTTEVPELSIESPTLPQVAKKPLRKIKVTHATPLRTEAEEKPSRKQSIPDQEGELPSSIFLKPKDVLVNRKPARRIPPGSASDKLKTLQEKRRKLLSNRVNPKRPIPVKVTTTELPTKVPEPTDDDEDDQDDDDDYYSDDEQIQKKREINQFSSSSENSNGAIARQQPSSKFSIEESTKVGIPKANSKLEATPISVPSLPIVEWFQGKSQPQTKIRGNKSQMVDELTEAESQVENTSVSSNRFTKNIGNSFGFTLAHRKSSTSSPFLAMSMSTNEPSLPLESYFPIVSSHSSSSKELTSLSG